MVGRLTRRPFTRTHIGSLWVLQCASRSAVLRGPLRELFFPGAPAMDHFEHRAATYSREPGKDSSAKRAADRAPALRRT